MKFANLLKTFIFALVILAIIDTISNTESKSKSNSHYTSKSKNKVKNKKAQSMSMMEYMNNFFSENDSLSLNDVNINLILASSFGFWSCS